MRNICWRARLGVRDYGSVTVTLKLFPCSSAVAWRCQMSFRLPWFLMVGLPEFCLVWFFFSSSPCRFLMGVLLGREKGSRRGRAGVIVFLSSGKITTLFPVMLSEIPHFLWNYGVSRFGIWTRFVREERGEGFESISCCFFLKYN